MPLQITSLQNARVKEAVKLRDRRDREKQQRIIIDGTRELERAIDGGVQLIEVFHCPELANDTPSDRVLEKLNRQRVEVLSVTREVFAKMAFGDRAEGLIGIAKTADRPLASLRLPPSPLVIVLVGIEKPGNVGAVLRSADGAGVSAVIIADAGTDLFNPNAIRASLGTIFTVPVCSATSDETLAWLRANRLQICAARVDGASIYTNISYREPTAFVLGSEAEGLPALWNDPEIKNISLPMLGAADSLNVSTTAAILVYEALRQRSVENGTSGALGFTS